MENGCPGTTSDGRLRPETGETSLLLRRLADAAVIAGALGLALILIAVGA